MPRKKKERLAEKEETKEEMWARHKKEKEDDAMQFIASLIVNLLVNQTEEEYQRMMINLRARMVADELKKLPEKPTDNEVKKQSSAKK
jgi:hypothetical protein